VYAEDSYALPTSVDVSNVIASRLGPNAAGIRLVSADANPAKRNTVNAILSLSGGGGASACDVGATWHGSVDFSPPLPNVGPGGGKVAPPAR
jgi:hypothetical protein